MTAAHVAHARTCESCGCTRECDGRCTTCSVCGAEWVVVTCPDCGPLHVYSEEPQYRSRLCPNCRPIRPVSAGVDAALNAWAAKSREEYSE